MSWCDRCGDELATGDHSACAAARRLEPPRYRPMSWCDRCGDELATGDHSACTAARRLEPPRFCPHCRRRMKVQVVPAGWTAVCVEHGTTMEQA